MIYSFESVNPGKSSFARAFAASTAFSFIVSAAISTVVSVVIVCPFTLHTIAQTKSSVLTAAAVICVVVVDKATLPKRV